jgi:hypothetical protein
MLSERQAVLKAAEKIVSDFGEHRASEYFSNFDTNATFIFYTHDSVLSSRKAYESLWGKWESENGFRVHSCKSTQQNVQLLSKLAIFTHQVETEVKFSGQTSVIRERETIVFEKQGEKWIAVHEHLSPIA